MEQEEPLSEPLSLAGRRVLITRARHQAGEMAAMVRDYGGTALCLPLTALGPPADPAPLDRALAGLDQVHWLVFTSPNAVDFTLSRLKDLKGAQAAEALSRCSLAAVGPGTAAALARWGPQARLMPTKFRWQELAQELLAQSRPGDHFLLPRSDRAVPQLPAVLQAAGRRVTEVEAYRTHLLYDQQEPLAQLLTEGDLDAVTLTSPSAVTVFAPVWQQLEERGSLQKKPLLAYIGPNTADAGRARGLPVDLVPRHALASELVAALARVLGPAP
ncbi:MAG TPA: uroporphyrinogen-III synthase [Sphingobacteriaceae bacterium]|nr:uroporphyrinogen-III synthase [Sphingobacteriaceae bacterium]